MGASPTAGFSCCSFMIGPGAPYLARQPSALAAFAVPYCGRDQLGYDAGRTYLRHSQIVTYRIVAARFIGAPLRQVQLDAAASWLKTPVLVHREPGIWIFSNERLERMSTLLGNWGDCSAFGPAQDIIERSREERHNCHTGCDSEPFQPMPHARVCAIGVNLVSCSEGKIIIQFLAKLPILAMF